MPLAAVASEAGITPSFLSEIENGNKSPSLDVANRICRAVAKLAEEFGDDGRRISLDDFVDRSIERTEAAE